VKRAYLAEGIVVTLVNAKDNILALDPVTWSYVSNLLDGDYCYLVIDRREVVRVQSVQAPNIVLVTRGVDGTERKTWPIGTRISYQLTGAEIVDATVAGEVAITAQYPIVKTGTELSYADFRLAGIGGVTVAGSDSTWLVQDIPDNAGCAASSEPPPIPLSYFDLRIVTEGYYRTTTDGSYRGYI
jgi:hypothetical protein